MKKLILTLFLVMFYATTAFAFHPLEHCIPSSELTASGSVVTSPGYLYGLMMTTDGTNAVTLDLYDSDSASPEVAKLSTHLIPLWNITTSATDREATFFLPKPMGYSSGLFASASCAGSYNIIFYYREK